MNENFFRNAILVMILNIISHAITVGIVAGFIILILHICKII